MDRCRDSLIEKLSVYKKFKNEMNGETNREREGEREGERVREREYREGVRGY